MVRVVVKCEGFGEVFYGEGAWLTTGGCYGWQALLSKALLMNKLDVEVSDVECLLMGVPVDVGVTNIDVLVDNDTLLIRPLKSSRLKRAISPAGPRAKVRRTYGASVSEQLHECLDESGSRREEFFQKVIKPWRNSVPLAVMALHFKDQMSESEFHQFCEDVKRVACVTGFVLTHALDGQIVLQAINLSQEERQKLSEAQELLIRGQVWVHDKFSPMTQDSSHAAEPLVSEVQLSPVCWMQDSDPPNHTVAQVHPRPSTPSSASSSSSSSEDDLSSSSNGVSQSEDESACRTAKEAALYTQLRSLIDPDGPRRAWFVHHLVIPYTNMIPLIKLGAHLRSQGAKTSPKELIELAKDNAKLLGGLTSHRFSIKVKEDGEKFFQLSELSAAEETALINRKPRKQPEKKCSTCSVVEDYLEQARAARRPSTESSLEDSVPPAERLSDLRACLARLPPGRVITVVEWAPTHSRHANRSSDGAVLRHVGAFVKCLDDYVVIKNGSTNVLKCLLLKSISSVHDKQTKLYQSTSAVPCGSSGERTSESDDYKEALDPRICEEYTIFPPSLSDHRILRGCVIPPAIRESRSVSDLNNWIRNEVAIRQQKIRRQLHWYFSERNLKNDRFLLSRLEVHKGKVPFALVASFNRLAEISKDLQFIIAAIRADPSPQCSAYTLADHEGDLYLACKAWPLKLSVPPPKSVLQPVPPPAEKTEAPAADAKPSSKLVPTAVMKQKVKIASNPLLAAESKKQPQQQKAQQQKPPPPPKQQQQKPQKQEPEKQPEEEQKKPLITIEIEEDDDRLIGLVAEGGSSDKEGGADVCRDSSSMSSLGVQPPFTEVASDSHKLGGDTNSTAPSSTANRIAIRPRGVGDFYI